MASKENEIQDTEFKATIIDTFKEFKEFKEDMNKQAEWIEGGHNVNGSKSKKIHMAQWEGENNSEYKNRIK